MSFSAIWENKIILKISEFTVQVAFDEKVGEKLEKEGIC